MGVIMLLLVVGSTMLLTLLEWLVWVVVLMVPMLVVSRLLGLVVWMLLQAVLPMRSVARRVVLAVEG